MFRDKEIIQLLLEVKAIATDCYTNVKIDSDFGSMGKLSQKIADIDEYCLDIKVRLEAIEERCLRDDEEFRLQIRLAIREYMEEQQLAKKKQEKKVVKKK